MSMFTFSTFLVTLAAADPGSAGATAPGRTARLAPLCAELDCSRQQRRELHVIDVELHEAMRLHHLRMIALRNSLRAEMRQDVLDRDDISRLRDEVDAARKEATAIVRDARRDMLAVLTPEQREELRAITKDGRERGVKRRGAKERELEADKPGKRERKVEKPGKRERKRERKADERHPEHHPDYTADVPMRANF